MRVAITRSNGAFHHQLWAWAPTQARIRAMDKPKASPTQPICWREQCPPSICSDWDGSHCNAQLFPRITPARYTAEDPWDLWCRWASTTSHERCHTPPQSSPRSSRLPLRAHGAPPSICSPHHSHTTAESTALILLQSSSHPEYRPPPESPDTPPVPRTPPPWCGTARRPSAQRTPAGGSRFWFRSSSGGGRGWWPYPSRLRFGAVRSRSERSWCRVEFEGVWRQRESGWRIE